MAFSPSARKATGTNTPRRVGNDGGRSGSGRPRAHRWRPCFDILPNYLGAGCWIEGAEWGGWLLIDLLVAGIGLVNI
jgi:hypothetical protein